MSVHEQAQVFWWLAWSATLLWAVIDLFAQWLARRESRRGDPVFDPSAVHFGYYAGHGNFDNVLRQSAVWDWNPHQQSGHHPMYVGGIEVPPDIAAILAGPTAPEPEPNE